MSNHIIKICLPCALDALVETINALEKKYGPGLMIVQDDNPNFVTIAKDEPMRTPWAKEGCRALDLDERIEPGDWVADVVGEDLSTGSPEKWVKAVESIGGTPRRLTLFACRPIRKDGGQ